MPHALRLPSPTKTSKVDQFRIANSYQVDDTTYTASALIDTEFDSKVARVSLGYSFWRAPDSEFGAVLGAHVTRFDFAIAGQGTSPGGPITLDRETARTTVPLPTLGLYGAYAWSTDWVVNGRADYLSLKHGRYDGRLLNLQANVFYRFNQNVSVGMGYRYDDYKVGVDRDALSGHVDYKFRGPQVLIDVGF